MMYLLLRNNKQTGPHSLEELKNMGLKAYDLVWLEGKSAAWRYPCEIDELSAFAPPVEEQPFDRFYKRPAQTAATTTAAGPSIAGKPAVSESIATPVTVESTKTPGKRIIYVTMPAGKTTREPLVTRETSNTTARAREPISSREPAREPLLTATNAPEPAREPLLTTANTPDPAHLAYASGSSYARAPIEDYSAHADVNDIPSVEFAPRSTFDPRPGSKPRKSGRILRFLAFGLAIIALLAAGIIIGLSLNKDTLPFQQKIAAKTPSAIPGQSIVHTTAQQLPAPVPNPTTLPVTARPADSVARIVSRPAPTTPAITKTIVKTTGPAIKTPGTKTPKEKPIHPTVQTNFTPVTGDSAAGVSAVVQREAVHRSDITETHPADNVDRETVRTTLAKQVSVGANGYTVGTFGGINDLQLTVTNRSAYPLDVVIVEVQYIQANKKVFKTENMYFRGIGAGAALMLEAPKSSRGIKVQYKITTISSKELGLSYSGI